MMRVCDQYSKDYNGMRALIAYEKEKASGVYKETLDALDAEIYLREGKNDDAVTVLKNNADRYKGTVNEVFSLMRLSEVYSVFKGDKEKGLATARLASEINPGQPGLDMIYDVSGGKYNPAVYTDRFAEKAIETGGQISTPETNTPEETTTEIQEFVNTNPNPANPYAMLMYSIKTPSHVKLSVYSINGQKVATIVDGHMSAGIHSVRFDGSKLASGLYFYKFQSAKFNKTGKIMLVK